MEKRFCGKTAIITGGASGMGLLLGKNLVEEGANVTLVDVNEEALMKATEGMDHVLPVVADVRDFAQVKASVDRTVETFGTVDIHVNMAGGDEARIKGSNFEFCDQPIEVLDWGLDVNLRAQIYYDHEVSRIMREKKTGVIVNIGSVVALEGNTRCTYPTAKSGAMYGLTRSMAQLGAKYGFRCVCVSPGPVLTRAAMANMRTPLGRAADPQEVVDLILFLCSDKAAYITGENIFIDGGRNILR